MSDEPNKQKESLNPYALVAMFSALGSGGIAFFAFLIMRTFTDAGMWAVAVMVAAPAVMGIGVAYFMSKRN